jgi:hypothetical protein
MILNNGEDWYPTNEDIQTLRGLYPRVDLEQEMRSMEAWLYSNPQRRKTSRGMMRFVNNWLQKSNQRTAGRHSPTSTRATTLQEDLTDTSWAT